MVQFPDLASFFCGADQRDQLENMDKASPYVFQREYKYNGPLCCYDVQFWRGRSGGPEPEPIVVDEDLESTIVLSKASNNT